MSRVWSMTLMEEDGNLANMEEEGIASTGIDNAMRCGRRRNLS